MLSPISPISMRRSGFFRLAGLLGVLENATKKQLHRFTGLNRCLATIATAVKIKPQVDGLLFLENAGMVGLHHSGPVIRHSFENCPLGTGKTDHFCLVEGWRDTVRHELGSSPTFGRISRTMPKSTILKSQVADSLFLKKQGYGQGPGGKRSRWARFVARPFRMPRLHSSDATFQALLRRSVPDDWVFKSVPND